MRHLPVILLLMLTGLTILACGWNLKQGYEYYQFRQTMQTAPEVAALRRAVESGDICRQCCAGGHPITPVQWRAEGRPVEWLIAGEEHD